MHCIFLPDLWTPQSGFCPAGNLEQKCLPLPHSQSLCSASLQHAPPCCTTLQTLAPSLVHSHAQSLQAPPLGVELCICDSHQWAQHQQMRLSVKWSKRYQSNKEGKCIVLSWCFQLIMDWFVWLCKTLIETKTQNTNLEQNAYKLSWTQK